MLVIWDGRVERASSRIEAVDRVLMRAIDPSPRPAIEKKGPQITAVGCESECLTTASSTRPRELR